MIGTYSCHGIEPAPDEEDGIHEKINQDRGCVVYPYNNHRNEALFIVLDGHGEHGDKVSEFVMRQIVVSLEKDPMLNVDPIAALKNAYVTTNTALLVTDIHYMTSGCTCVTIYIKGNGCIYGPMYSTIHYVCMYAYTYIYI
jgi:serine/threonine protein phosphatase PrpC